MDNISLDDQEERRFGLPTLSISGPSPPEDDDEQRHEVMVEDEMERFLK